MSERKPLSDDDMVEWLRHAPAHDWDSQTLNEAADAITRLREAIQQAYAILCSGKPPHSPREANARRVLRRAGAKTAKKVTP